MEDFKDYKKAFDLVYSVLPGEEVKYSPVLNTEPRWCHMYSVYKNCIRWGVTDKDILIAAILHDVLEDSHFSQDEMKKKFGERVVKIVKLVSKKKDYKSFNPADQEEYFGGIIGCTDLELRKAAITVKLADRIENLQRIYFIDDLAEIKNYIIETEKWFYIMAKEINKKAELTDALNFLRTRINK